MYEYKARIVRIVDGDTVDVDIDLGFGIWLTDERVRIMGIDTPESRTSNEIEKIFGKAAKERLKELLGPYATLKTRVANNGEDMRGKFGRVLGDFLVYYHAQDRVCGVAEILINEGHAVGYEGENKELVQEQHRLNRRRLIDEGKVHIPEGMRHLIA